SAATRFARAARSGRCTGAPAGGAAPGRAAGRLRRPRVPRSRRGPRGTDRHGDVTPLARSRSATTDDERRADGEPSEGAMTRSWSDQARAGNDTAVAEDDLQAYVDG